MNEDPSGLRRLTQRAAIVRAVRRFFEARDYLEVEPPVAVESPGLEPHLDAFELRTDGPRRYLHTSPEYALKRLLGAGATRVFALTPCFRDEPPSRTHAPEFTMLEWYTAGFGLTDLMDQTEALVRTCAAAVEAPLDEAAFGRLTVQAAFVEHAGIDPFESPTGAALKANARALGLAAPTDSEDWDDVFFQVFLNHVEPALAAQPTFLSHYPASQAALARMDPDDPRFALRFELYGGGLELANAFDELTDAAEQRRRFQADQAARRALDLPVYPIDEALLDRLESIPQTAGIALGIDRLVMWLTGAHDIADVRLQSW